MIRASCKYGVRHKGLRYRGQILREIILFQAVVLARPTDVAHQGRELQDFVLR